MENNKVNRSIYIEEMLWDRASEKASRPDIKRGLSQIISRLLELWLDDEVMPFPERVEGTDG